MTVDDVQKLTETAHNLMLTTLKDISEPSPKSTPSASPEPPSAVIEKNARVADGARLRTLAVTPPESLGSRGETTEDEMDEDAVVLKHPKK